MGETASCKAVWLAVLVASWWVGGAMDAKELEAVVARWRPPSVHLDPAVARRRLYDLGELTARDDANILNGTCKCPYAASRCDTATIYNNSMLFVDDESEPMLLLMKRPMPLDTASAGNDACQEIDGIELCLNASCVPEPNYLIYDCDKLTETLLGVAAWRAHELAVDDINNTLREVLGLTGNDDAFGNLSLEVILVYALLEQTRYYSCSGGCNLYRECAALCADTATDYRDQAIATLAASDDCTGTVPFLEPTVIPTTYISSIPTVDHFPAPSIGPVSAPTAGLIAAPATQAPTLRLSEAPKPYILDANSLTSGTSKKKGSALTAGAVVGIVVGGVIFVLVCCVCCMFFTRRKNRRENNENDGSTKPVVVQASEPAAPEAVDVVYTDPDAAPKSEEAATLVPTPGAKAKIEEADL